MWVRDGDKMEFDTEEEAFYDACDGMLDYSEEYLKPWVSYDKLVAWAMKHNDFFDKFRDELYKAQQDYFNDFYFEVEDEDEDC